MRVDTSIGAGQGLIQKENPAVQIKATANGKLFKMTHTCCE